MLYYLVEFDPKPGVTQREVADAYRRFVEHYTKIFPQMQMEGLFARDMLLGTRPHYFALWAMPDYATLDVWKKAYAGDPDGARLTREINDMGVEWNAKIVKRLLQASGHRVLAADDFAAIYQAQFDQLYDEGARSRRVMCIALHPFQKDMVDYFDNGKAFL